MELAHQGKKARLQTDAGPFREWARARALKGLHNEAIGLPSPTRQDTGVSAQVWQGGKKVVAG